MKIKSGDTVIVVSGHYKGTTGKVSKAFPKTNKVIVEGVNLRKKHMKPSQSNPEGKIVEIYAPIDVSNVMIVDPKTQKPTRVGYKIVKDKKVRVAKKSDSVLD